MLPLHWAARKSASEAVVKALLCAYPDAAKAKDYVRETACLCPHLTYAPLLPSHPAPNHSRVQAGDLPKDYAKTDTIKALLV